MTNYTQYKALELHKLVMVKMKASNKNYFRTDHDVIRDNHRFLWDDDEEPEEWEQRVAKKYYEKLFKEYCICDLTRYKDNQIAMRWRTESEVVTGNGHFICGSKHCRNTEELRSWEVNFVYVEHGAKKNALVKLRLCPDCSKKLNYSSTKRLVRKEKRKHSGNIKKRKSHAEDETTGDIPCETEPSESVQNDTNEASTSTKDQWKHIEVEEQTRETEFEGFLEDLLL